MSLLTLRNISRSAASCATRSQNSKPLHAVLLSSTAERRVPSTRKITCAAKKESIKGGPPSLCEPQPRKRDRLHGAMLLQVVWRSHTCRCLPLHSHLATQDCACSITADCSATPHALNRSECTCSAPACGIKALVRRPHLFNAKNKLESTFFRVCFEMKRKHLSAEDGAALLRKSLMKGVTVLCALFAVGRRCIPHERAPNVLLDEIVGHNTSFIRKAKWAIVG